MILHTSGSLVMGESNFDIPTWRRHSAAEGQRMIHHPDAVTITQFLGR